MKRIYILIKKIKRLLKNKSSLKNQINSLSPIFRNFSLLIHQVKLSKKRKKYQSIQGKIISLAFSKGYIIQSLNFFFDSVFPSSLKLLLFLRK